MPTQAKSAFDKNILRARYFLDIHEATQSGAGAPTKPRRELPRGAIVFAVGAIDAYLCEVSAEVLVEQILETPAGTGLREILTRVQKEVPVLALEVALLKTHKLRIERIRSSIVEWFQMHTSQLGAKGVSSTIIRLGGNPDDVWSSLIQQGYDEPQKTLDYWTDIRHQVVHQGRSPKVWRPQAREFIDFARALVQRVDNLVSK